MIDGSSESMTSPVRPNRQCWWMAWAWAMTGCRGSNPLGSSYAPSSPGTDASAHSAPGPNAAEYTSPECSLESTIKVAGPWGVRRPRQWRPARSILYVGSPLPRRWTPRTDPTGTGQPGSHRRTWRPLRGTVDEVMG